MDSRVPGTLVAPATAPALDQDTALGASPTLWRRTHTPPAGGTARADILEGDHCSAPFSGAGRWRRQADVAMQRRPGSLARRHSSGSYTPPCERISTSIHDEGRAANFVLSQLTMPSMSSRLNWNDCRPGKC